MSTPRGMRPLDARISGKWRITGVLRAGTAAALYVATARSGSPVCLKIVHTHLARDEGVKRRFAEEADLAARLEHPGVMRILDEGTADDGAPLLLLEPLDGETLEARAEQLGGKLPIDEAYDIAELLLDVLAAAHRVGVLHFELTPQNLFLTDAGVLKVLDFGALDARPQSMLQRGQATIRWPAAFTAPELLLDEPSDARSDIFAVGALLYNLVTGETARPHDAPAASVASVPVRSLTATALNLPRAFVSIVDRALEFDRADRWPDVSAMQQALRWARRSLEAGWGEAKREGAPRPMRSSLADQANRSRQRASIPPPGEGASGPSSNTMMGRWSKDGASLESDAKETPQTVPPQGLLTEQTLVGVEAPVRPESPSAPPVMRLSPRRASEPTLKSASLTDSDRQLTPAVSVGVTTEPASQRELEESTLTRKPPRPAAGRPASEPPPEYEDDTLIRKAFEQSSGAPAALPSDPPPSTDPPTPPATGAPVTPQVAIEAAAAAAAAAAERESTPALADGGDESERVAQQGDDDDDDAETGDHAAARPQDQPPPTVRLPSRNPPPPMGLPLKRTLTIAAIAGVFVGGLAFLVTTGNRRGSKVTLDDEAGTAVAIASSVVGEDAAVAFDALDATAGFEIVGSDDAAVDAAAERDAAAELEERLAAERRRRRELRALEAARAEAGVGAGESSDGGGATARPAASDAGTGTGTGTGASDAGRSGSGSKSAAESDGGA